VLRLGFLLLALAVLPTGAVFAGEEGALRVPLGHASAVTAIAASEDGALLLSGGRDGAVRLHDRASGLEIRVLEARTEPITAVALTPDGRRAIVSSGRPTLSILDTATGALLHEPDIVMGEASRIAVSRDGRRAVVASWVGGVKVVDIEAGKVLRRFQGHRANATAADLVGEEGLALSGARDGSLLLWRIETGEVVREVAKAGEAPVTALRVARDGKTAAVRRTREKSGEVEGLDRIEVIDLASGAVRTTIALEAGAGRIALRMDLWYAVVGTYDRATVYDLRAGAAIGRSPGHAPEGGTAIGGGIIHEVTSLAWDESGRYFMTGSKQGEIMVHDATNPPEAQRIRRRVEALSGLALSPDGRTALVGAADATAYVWDLATGRLERTITGLGRDGLFGQGHVIGCAFSPDGRRALLVSVSGASRLYDTAGWKELRVLADGEKLYAAVFRPDGSAIVARDAAYRILELDPETGAITRVLGKTGELCETLVAARDGTVYACARNDRQLFIFGKDGKATRWNREPAGPDAITSVSDAVLSADGRALLAWGGGLLARFDVATGARVEPSLRLPFEVARIALFPDGKRLLACGAGAQAMDLATGAPLARYEGHEGLVKACAVSADGRRVVTAGADGALRVFDAASGALLAGMVADASGEHVAFTQDGFVSGSAGGPARFLAAVSGTRLVPAERLLERAFDPAEVRARLAGGGASKGRSTTVLMGLLLEGTHPPSVRITAPADGATVSSESVRVEVLAADRGIGVSEVRLFLNGKLVSEETRGFKDELSRSRTAGKPAAVTRTFEVRLAPGPNELKAVAWGDVRIESEPALSTVTLAAPRPEAVLHLVAVGIDAYANERYRLRCARGDAEAFAATLSAACKGITARVETRLLLDAAATRPLIEAAVREVTAKARPADIFVFYFAGHGVMSEPLEGEGAPELFLVPVDVTRLYGDADGLRAKALPASLLRSWAKAVPAQKSLFILDACQSGGALEQFAMRGAAEEKALFQLARSAGTVVLAAAGSEQTAGEAKALGHGVFTYALLEGLSGKADGGARPDGKVTVKELEAYLGERVPELTREHRGQAQYPQGFAVGQDFPIGLVPAR